MIRDYAAANAPDFHAPYCRIAMLGDENRNLKIGN